MAHSTSSVEGLEALHDLRQKINQQKPLTREEIVFLCLLLDRLHGLFAGLNEDMDLLTLSSKDR